MLARARTLWRIAPAEWSEFDLEKKDLDDIRPQDENASPAHSAVERAGVRLQNVPGRLVFSND